MPLGGFGCRSSSTQLPRRSPCSIRSHLCAVTASSRPVGAAWDCFAIGHRLAHRTQARPRDSTPPWGAIVFRSSGTPPASGKPASMCTLWRVLGPPFRAHRQRFHQRCSWSVDHFGFREPQRSPSRMLMETQRSRTRKLCMVCNVHHVQCAMCIMCNVHHVQCAMCIMCSYRVRKRCQRTPRCRPSKLGAVPRRATGNPVGFHLRHSTDLEGKAPPLEVSSVVCKWIVPGTQFRVLHLY